MVSLSQAELIGLANALNEVCNGIQIYKEEFNTRLGVDRDLRLSLHREFIARAEGPPLEDERVEVWVGLASGLIRGVYGLGVDVVLACCYTLVRWWILYVYVLLSRNSNQSFSKLFGERICV